MAVTDVAAFVGPHPFRHLAHTDPGWLLAQMDRLEIARAWVSHLPSAFLNDPAPGNAALEAAVAPHRERVLPVPVVHPGLPDWEHDIARALDAGAPAVRLWPCHQGLDPDGAAVGEVLAALGERRCPAVLAVRLEDRRQRHPLDVAHEVAAAAVRALVRRHAPARILVSHADRAFIEEVHFGLAPEESRRILWDIAWLWGPPADELALLLETVGPERFVLGTGMPLRIPDTPFARLDLLAASPAVRRAVLGDNLDRWIPS